MFHEDRCKAVGWWAWICWASFSILKGSEELPVCIAFESLSLLPLVRLLMFLPQVVDANPMAANPLFSGPGDDPWKHFYEVRPVFD